MELDQFDEYLDEIVDTLRNTLKEKNRSYGGSAVNPLGIFTKASVKERLCIRIEDKLKRIEALGLRGFDEDNLNDLIGYLLILKIQDLHEERERQAAEKATADQSEGSGKTSESKTTKPTNNIVPARGNRYPVSYKG